MAVLSRMLPWLALVGAVAACRTGPAQWGPFRAQVIDAETDRPIAGAYVMVTWMREPPSLHFSQKLYDAQETMTDTAGRFDTSRKTRLLTAFVSEPGIAVFVPGYLMQELEVTPQNGRPYVEPTIVKMRPLKTREERCKFEPFGVLPDAHPYAPRFVRALRDYQSELKCSESR